MRSRSSREEVRTTTGITAAADSIRFSIRDLQSVDNGLPITSPRRDPVRHVIPEGIQAKLRVGSIILSGKHIEQIIHSISF